MATNEGGMIVPEAGDVAADEPRVLVREIQEILYWDDRLDPPGWNLQKEWDCCDVAQYVAGALADRGLAPRPAPSEGS